MYTNTH